MTWATTVSAVARILALRGRSDTLVTSAPFPSPLLSRQEGAMKQEFMLRWATADEVRVHAGGEWQLRFRGHRSRDFANQCLFLDHWLPVKNSRMMKSSILSSMMEPDFPTFCTSCTLPGFRLTK